MDNPVLTQWLTQPDGLATRLRQLREAAGLTGKALADRLGWVPAKVSRVQGGRTLPGPADVEAWCRECGAVGQADELVELLAEASARHLPWRQRLARGYRGAQAAYTELHRRSSAVTMVEVVSLPGPVQTPGYARALLEAWATFPPGREHPAGDLDEAIAARMERSALVDNSDRSYRFVVGEAALLGAVASAATMVHQLDHLAKMAGRSNVELWVVPLEVGLTAVPLHSFGIYTINGTDLVLAETFHGEQEYTTERDVDLHHHAVRWLQATAAAGDAAVRIVNDARTKLLDVSP